MFVLIFVFHKRITEKCQKKQKFFHFQIDSSFLRWPVEDYMQISFTF